MIKTIFRNFKGSFLIALIGFIAAYFLGGSEGFFIAVILTILEVSLSFDNAVINAKVLKDMDSHWQQRFLTWGMLIAVFGMRLVFPVLIVSILGNILPTEAVRIALEDPVHYAHILESAHIAISGFGGGFLFMVFFNFVFDHDKEIHWIYYLEKQLTKIARLESVEIIIALLISFFIAYFLSSHEAYEFLGASIFGIIIFLIVHGIEKLLSHRKSDVTGEIARSGLASFLYLEVLDASFSFDGVIGAFALSKNIFVIMLGLGIGALFVRSITVFLVRQGTLAQFRYLEHGAYWAIGVLASIMYISTFNEVPELVTGLLGLVFIVTSIWSSMRYNNKNKSELIQ